MINFQKIKFYVGLLFLSCDQLVTHPPAIKQSSLFTWAVRMPGYFLWDNHVNYQDNDLTVPQLSQQTFTIRHVSKDRQAMILHTDADTCPLIIESEKYQPPVNTG